MNDKLRLLSGLIVCLQFDDFAVLKSPKGTLPVRGRLSLVIYEKPRSICDINFQNECQNDVVLRSFNVSRCNVFHGTGSEAFLCPSGETRKLVKVRNCVTNVRSVSQWITAEKAECADTALDKSSNTMSGD